MDAREVKVIDTSGRNGLPGPEYWITKPAEAPYGQPGQSGESAGAPTAGQPASDIRVRLTYSYEETGIVQVTGEGPHTGQLWKIARDEKLRLNVKGGDGGAGGRGEDGQAGGRGRDGRNATRYHNGENGENGARGGDGGYGSNGADGAAAGNVYITVHDDDTDLLVPLEYDLRGGAGGASGQHGEPGDGGVGGRGGAPHAWTERYGNTVSAHTRPGGTNGTNGPPGERPATYLTGGKTGPQGSVQIKVIRGDLSEATYPSPYALQVINFDIIDENEDGINEPGEHIIVHNIRVRNVGGMPSPESRSIHLLIQGTQFLEPKILEPLELPRSIQPGQEVDVPGVLRAYIRNEWSEKPIGSALNYFDKVQLLAIFHERLNRAIPNFCVGFTQILIRYPLILDAPRYLDCVSKSDRVRFNWVVHNDSKKVYGVNGPLGRKTATKLSDPAGLFKLTHAVHPTSHEATDELDEIEPNSIVPIDQDFNVDEKTLEFSEGYLTLELMLEDPINGKMRSIQKHQMYMQISGKYELSKNPSYLLVVNSKTPNAAIHQIIHLIRNRLHTHLDIFNLSLTGSYESPVSNENVLKSYTGRSVIIFGNNFPCFSEGNKDPWELLDPWQTGLLVKGGTNILFAGVSPSNLNSLKKWAEHATFPADDFAAAVQPANYENIDQVVARLKQPSTTPLTSNFVVHRFPVQKGLCGNIRSTVDSKAKSAARKLNKNFPLRRFIAVPDMEALREAENLGGVILCEGIPKNSKMMASVGFPMVTDHVLNISDYNLFFIVSCLPFAVKARMFWNMIGRSDATGVPCTTIYSGLERLYYALSEAPGQTIVDEKILQALCVSLQFEISSEIYRFTATKPRFRDPLTVPEKVNQLPLFTQFFDAAPTNAQVDNIGRAHLLISTLGTIHAISNPIGFWQNVKSAFAFLGNRKGQLTPTLNESIFAAITGSCSPNVVATVNAGMLQRSKQVNTGIQATAGPKSFTNFGTKELPAIFSGPPVELSDLIELKPISVSLSGAEFQNHHNTYHLHRRGTEHITANAKNILNTMVNPVDGEPQ